MAPVILPPPPEPPVFSPRHREGESGAGPVARDRLALEDDLCPRPAGPPSRRPGSSSPPFPQGQETARDPSPGGDALPPRRSPVRGASPLDSLTPGRFGPMQTGSRSSAPLIARRQGGAAPLGLSCRTGWAPGTCHQHWTSAPGAGPLPGRRKVACTGRNGETADAARQARPATVGRNGRMNADP
jgi:hypothetical protein